MKVLQLHCDYSTSLISGENTSVSLIHDALENILGVNARLIRFSTANLSKSRHMRLMALVAYLKKDKGLIRASKKFDIVIIHNTIPFISSRTIWHLLQSRIVIFTWHNSRRLCISGTNSYQGRACFACETHTQLAGIFRRCYRYSFLQSLLVSLNQRALRKVLDHRNARHLVFSEDMRSRIVFNQLAPQGEIHLLEHFIDDEFSSPLPNAQDFLAVGRLDLSKGFYDLVMMWNLIPTEKKFGAKLHIVGAGPEAERIASIATDNSVIMHGAISQDEIRKIATVCRVGVVPSIGPETFGRVVLEYMCFGLIPIVRPAGALTELVGRVNTNWVIDDMSNEKLIAKLIEILNYSKNETKRLHQHVRNNYGRSSYIKKFESLLENLVR
jgi:glycosyltransferase involved in cell wall biosynthesis